MTATTTMDDTARVGRTRYRHGRRSSPARRGRLLLFLNRGAMLDELLAATTTMMKEEEDFVRGFFTS